MIPPKLKEILPIHKELNLTIRPADSRVSFAINAVNLFLIVLYEFIIMFDYSKTKSCLFDFHP